MVTFVNGESMSGQLVKVTDGKVFFHSDMVGDVSFDWDKVKDLKTTKPFAVVPKGAKIGKHGEGTSEGTIAVSDNKLSVASTTVPTGDAAFVVDQPTFEKQMHHNGFLTGWVGAITAGVSLVRATQDNTNFTSSFTFQRRSPTAEWMTTRSRTLIDFTNVYGKVTQAGTPDVKTSIYHADGEQDEYFSERFYALGHASFDHNFSQGLDLQQLYGGGLGFTVLKTKIHELDFKGDLHYEKQQFDVASSNQNLIGSEFVESYIRKLAHGMVFTEGVLYDAAWNNTTAYSAQGTIGLAAPFSKRFSLSINLLDGYINNPPPAFKKNSLQFTTGLTYTVK
ncbi:DUF481 domain-containing protein [Candidatus Korobacter versatilis]|nr:DUF481 domain-containing protein [Candidatus Koribacter versatilis]